METTSQFPVDPGTAVEVTCLHTDAVNKGSSEVTCITGKLYTFEVEPSCPGKVLKFKNLTTYNRFSTGTGSLNDVCQKVNRRQN